MPEHAAVERRVEHHERTLADHPEQAGQGLAGCGVERGVVSVRGVQQATVDAHRADREQVVAVEIEPGRSRIHHHVAAFEGQVVEHGVGQGVPGAQGLLCLRAEGLRAAAGGLETG